MILTTSEKLSKVERCGKQIRETIKHFFKDEWKGHLIGCLAIFQRPSSFGSDDLEVDEPFLSPKISEIASAVVEIVTEMEVIIDTFVTQKC